MLRALAENRGIIMINFCENFIDPDKAGVWRSVRHALANFGWVDTPFSALIDHFEHTIEVAGIDHVGLGSDFDGCLFMPEGMKDVSQYPSITLALLERGYSEEDIRKVLGENLLRVFGELEAVASSPERP